MTRIDADKKFEQAKNLFLSAKVRAIRGKKKLATDDADRHGLKIPSNGRNH